MILQIPQNALLEGSRLLLRQGIGFRNDRYQVDFTAQPFHVFDIEGLQAVPCGFDKVQACVHPVIYEFCAVDPALLVEVGIEASFDVVENRLPRLAVVYEITKSRCIDHGEFEPHTALFDICRDGFDVDRFRTLGRWVEHALGWIQRGVEEGVYEGRLA